MTVLRGKVRKLIGETQEPKPLITLNFTEQAVREYVATWTYSAWIKNQNRRA